ncbi:NUDIX domain-containing protein (plasmid) [Streptomyces sp. BI20]|uniref:NUDIX domain-containing protein n=1 Tax=Streptomyces sp. BI20 TaxID=3403460 RepID=UPI003C78D4EB
MSTEENGARVDVDTQAEVRFDADGSLLVVPLPSAEAPGDGVSGGAGTGERYRFPLPGESSVEVPLPFHSARWVGLGPVGTAETVLRAWALGGPEEVPTHVPWVDPAAVPPVRVRAGAVILHEGALLTIAFREDDGRVFHEFPGGGVEPGETLREAVVREVREETGLGCTVGAEIARVWKGGRREHYFLVAPEGEIGPPESLDNYGGVPTWLPLSTLAEAPLWPRRLTWRVAEQAAAGYWPVEPWELADSIHDLWAPCHW